MRKAFNEELLKIAHADPRVFMILADIGYGEIEPFANAFPDRFINCGVAEQNMTGVACGVAMEGNIAITYSIANFPTLRCFEQIRNDMYNFSFICRASKNLQNIKQKQNKHR